MVRSQIQFTEEQHRRLKRWAARLGISVAEAVRRCVADWMAAEDAAPSRAAMVREAMAAAGAYTDPAGLTDAAQRHDELLGDAYRR